MIIYGIVALLLSALIGWLSDRLWQLRSAEEQAKADAEYQQQLAAAQAAGHAPGQPATSAQPTMTPQAGAPTPPPPPAR
jgi:predicted negative regulator of RcsB-dependent stress response